MKRINKILSSKRSLTFVVFMIMLILFLTSGKELLHNHQPDLIEHNDCPVLIISQVLSSGITVHFEISSEHTVEFNFDKLQLFSLSQPKQFILSSRGPPLV